MKGLVPAARGGGQAAHRAGHRAGGDRQPPARRPGGQGHRAPRPRPDRALRHRDQRRRAGPQLRPGPGGRGPLALRGVLAAGHRGHGLRGGPGGHHRGGPARGGRAPTARPACWCRPTTPGRWPRPSAGCSTTPSCGARLGAAGRERVLGRFTWQVTAAGHRRPSTGPCSTVAPRPTEAASRMLTVDYDRLGVRAGRPAARPGLRLRPPRLPGRPPGRRGGGLRRRGRRGAQRAGHLRGHGRGRRARPGRRPGGVGAGRRPGPALRRRLLRPGDRLGGPRAHPRRRAGHGRAGPGAAARAAPWPSPCPAAGPSSSTGRCPTSTTTCPAATSASTARASWSSGSRAPACGPPGSHHAHGLHAPYWWLRCLVGTDQRHPPGGRRLPPAAGVGHREGARRSPGYADRVLNPLVGKSLVVYLVKPPTGRRPHRVGPGRRRTAATGRVGRRWHEVDPRGPRRHDRRPRCWPRPESIAALQRPDGMIPWFPGGHCDPWNHVEAAMALTAVGLDDEADRAYRWLVDTQLPDGSWFNYYLATGVKDARLDTNVCAYLATGAWHRYVSTGDLDGLEQLWPTVEAGVDFVLRWQRPDGSIRWSLDSVRLPRGVRPAHRVVVDLPQPALRHRLRRAAGPRAARLGAGRRPPGPRRGPPPRGLRPQGRVRHGLVLPDPVRGPERRGRPPADRRLVVDTFVHGRPRGALRVDRRVGDGRRDGRVRAGPRRPGTRRRRPSSCSAGSRPCATRTAPTGRAWSTPRRPRTRRSSARPTRPGPWSWPPTPSAGPRRRRALPGRGAAQPSRPHRAGSGLARSRPAVRAPGPPGRH